MFLKACVSRSVVQSIGAAAIHLMADSFEGGQVAPKTGSGVLQGIVFPKACSYEHQFAKWSLEERNLSFADTSCIPYPRKLPVPTKGSEESYPNEA